MIQIKSPAWDCIAAVTSKDAQTRVSPSIADQPVGEMGGKNVSRYSRVISDAGRYDKYLARFDEPLALAPCLKAATRLFRFW
jgi:hypothetical protein